MLPGELARAADSAVDDSPTRPAPRTARDWAVDVAVFLFAVLIWVGEFTTSVLPNLYGLPEWIRVVDPILGAAACLALWWRRRFPLALGIGAGVAGALSNTAVAAVAVLIFSLALHRGWKWAVPVALAGILAGSPYIVMYFPGNIGPPTLWLIMLTLVTMLVVTMGLAVRARRQLVWALRLRADAALVDQQRQLEDSRRTERENIAREIHDTLAHRISLLSVHAGALEYRTLMAESGTTSALTAAEVRETVGVLRTNAHLALEELRDVLHVLHRDTTATDRAAPQPTVAQLTQLLDEAEQSGQQVDADLGSDLSDLRPQLQRTIYRVVQEGLTNARKHAPGARVRIVVGGEPEAGIAVQVSNPVPVGVTASEIPGARAGLVGLTERVALHGGVLTTEVRGGHFRLLARIPWAA